MGCDPQHYTNVLCTSITHDFSADFISIPTFTKYKIPTEKAHQPKYYKSMEIRAIMTTTLLSNVYVVIKRVLKPRRKKSRVVRSSTRKYLQTKAQKVVSEKLCISVVGSEDMLQNLPYYEYETCKEFQIHAVAVFKMY